MTLIHTDFQDLQLVCNSRKKLIQVLFRTLPRIGHNFKNSHDQQERQFNKKYS